MLYGCIDRCLHAGHPGLVLGAIGSFACAVARPFNLDEDVHAFAPMFLHEMINGEFCPLREGKRAFKVSLI